MKRFTETEKWRDPWFRRLSCQAKLLWLYILDHCDKIGLVEIDLTLASTDCGQNIEESHLAELSGRVEDCGTGKFFLPKFINFQYGALTDKCPPHRSIISLVESHGLVRDGLLYHYPTARVALPLRQDKTRQEEEKEWKGIEKNSPINEICTEDEAVSQMAVVGVPDGFVRFVHQDWSSRSGKDAGGVLVDFRPYCTKRWARERNEWTNGTHRAKTNGNGAKTHLSGIDKVLLKKELDAVEAEMASIKGSYEYHQGMGEWSAAHRTRHAELKTSRAELRNRLGMKA